jgi:hypothetical protein
MFLLIVFVFTSGGDQLGKPSPLKIIVLGYASWNYSHPASLDPCNNYERVEFRSRDLYRYST